MITIKRLALGACTLCLAAGASTAVAASEPPAEPDGPLATFTGEGTQTIDIRSAVDSGKSYLMDVTWDADDVWDTLEIFQLDADFNGVNVGWDGVTVWDADHIDGRYPLDWADDTDTAFLTIETDGMWTVKVQPLDAVERWAGGSISGRDADVLRYTGPSAIAAFDWQGDDGCWSIDVDRNDDDARSDADVSGCDPASGTMPMPSEPNVPNVSIVIIDGEGDWELNVDVPDVVVAPTVYDTAPE